MTEVAIAHLLLEQGLIASSKLNAGVSSEADANFYKGKLETVRFYVINYMTQVFGRARTIKMSDMSAMDIQEEWL